MALMIPGHPHVKKQAISQIKENGSLIVEKEVIVQVPVETVVEVIKEVIVEVPVEVVRTVYIDKAAEIITVDKIVYVDKIVEIEKEVFVDRVVEVVKEVAIHTKVTDIEELRKKDISISKYKTKYRIACTISILLLTTSLILLGVR